MVNYQPLRILYLASEAVPFIKVGGLGDVAGSLPLTLRGLSQTSDPSSVDTLELSNGGLDIRLVIPFHDVIRQRTHTLRPVASFNVPHKDGPIPADVYGSEIDGLPVYLISGPPIPPGTPVYTGDNAVDGYKYAFFSMAALKLPFVLGWQPHILHANDWHTAPAVYALKLLQSTDEFYAGIATVLSVHNLPYLGLGAEQALESFGIPPAGNSRLPAWAQNLPLPLGLLAADQIVAVSPTYAKEILTPEFGSGLAEFLQTRSQVVSGILNGIDISRWDPATDAQLPANYSIHSLPNRAANKEALIHELGLDPLKSIPLLAMITQMDRQKGVDLALEALAELAETCPDLAWQVVLFGTGAANLEAAARKLEIDYPQRVRTVIRADAALTCRIFAGADMILIPSRYEPCGVTQMVAQRYGCVPIARATGGLCDAIRDAGQARATGFLFEEASPKALTEAILRALSIYSDRRRWRRLQHYGMLADFSWENSARQYLHLYRAVLSQKRSNEQGRET
jgi:starch synthase